MSIKLTVAVLHSLRMAMIISLSILADSASAQTILQSSVERTSLLELYTSEGCSSCPPADRWLGTLSGHPLLWEKLVPIAFHVDYWDELGWKDRFGRPEFSQRQVRYAQEEAIPVPYTPGFILNGEEWRNSKRELPPLGGSNVGLLTTEITTEEMEIEFAPTKVLVGETLIANIALLGFDLSTEIRAGENRGRSVSHAFVVLEFNQETMINKSGKFFATTSRPRSNHPSKRYAIALWVSTDKNQAPLQAVGGWLTANN